MKRAEGSWRGTKDPVNRKRGHVREKEGPAKGGRDQNRVERQS
jgi:hypothetical protein